MTSMRKSAAVVSAVIGIMSGFQAVSAHHSGSMFDPTRTEIVTGMVKELRWVNPHVSILVLGTIRDGDEPSE
jgi:hypothetical protein